MAFINRSKSFSMVFLAIATLLVLAGGAHGGGDLCRRADYPGVCREVVKGRKRPYAAMQATVRRLIAETAAARVAGKNRQVLGVCNENYEDALSRLKASLGKMRSRDKGSFNSNLSAALTDYETCEDVFSEMGTVSQLSKTNTRLR